MKKTISRYFTALPFGNRYPAFKIAMWATWLIFWIIGVQTVLLDSTTSAELPVWCLVIIGIAVLVFSIVSFPLSLWIISFMYLVAEALLSTFSEFYHALKGDLTKENPGEKLFISKFEKDMAEAVDIIFKSHGDGPGKGSEEDSGESSPSDDSSAEGHHEESSESEVQVLKKSEISKARSKKDKEIRKGARIYIEHVLSDYLTAEQINILYRNMLYLRTANSFDEGLEHVAVVTDAPFLHNKSSTRIVLAKGDIYSFAHNMRGFPGNLSYEEQYMFFQKMFPSIIRLKQESFFSALTRNSGNIIKPLSKKSDSNWENYFRFLANTDSKE